ncbi:EscU/YscU/HrcU family type III secretion system export apparatus switch protein [Thiobacillus denitrificans]|uniref:EscU/YscU/HrcU family type III secretion system export apparatus switch protein n=1 Tax=Thiobacillus denitrificans TaxID=36861 RepID=UPI000365A039|nr:EscU/YscU/HrcU family type III secretion system export apparatus switch protein [Thiobacillus denitrificans]
MAAETDLSRTEPASPQRLQQARSAGDVPRSAELTAWVVLLSALGMLGWLAPQLLNALQAMTEAAFIHAARPLSPVFLETVWSALWALLPLLAVIFFAALVAPILLSGWVFAPQVSRAEPFKSFTRLLSVDFLFDGTQALLKLVLAVAAVGWALASGWPELQDLASSGTGVALPATAAWVGRGVLALTAALALSAALDAGWRWWRYLRRHAMTWQEVLAEARESEVHPEMRARLRGRQQRAGQRPLPEGEETNVMPGTIDEVIG